MTLPLFEAIVLGVLQGATEFIPVSSSAHLIIVPWLLGWNSPVLTSLSFDIALHLGTLLAVLIYFARDFVSLIRAGLASIRERCIGSDPERRLAWFVVIGTIPGGIVGFLGESRVEALFHQPGVPVRPGAMIIMAVIMALLGVLLLLADWFGRHQSDLRHLTLRQALEIGLAQALAVFPGVSRSGSTITAGLAAGLKREDAARFSFLLSAPIIAGAGFKGVLEIAGGIQTGAIPAAEWAIFPLGVIAAALSGYLCIRFMLMYLQNHRMDVFVYYRFALALLIVIVALSRWPT